MKNKVDFAVKQAIEAAKCLHGNQKWGALFALRIVAFHLDLSCHKELARESDKLREELKGKEKK